MIRGAQGTWYQSDKRRYDGDQRIFQHSRYTVPCILNDLADFFVRFAQNGRNIADFLWCPYDSVRPRGIVPRYGYAPGG